MSVKHRRSKDLDSPATAAGAAMLAQVQRSPALVGVWGKQRGEWLGLFGAAAFVEDPVGCPAHAGRAAVAKFFDTFVAANRITFEVRSESVCAARASVWRDVELLVEFPSGGSARQPAHLHYQFDDGSADGGQPPRLVSLQAYWSVDDQRPGWQFNSIR